MTEDETPLSDLANDVRARRETDPTDESPFEAVDVETVDGEALWDAVVDGTDGPSVSSSETTDGPSEPSSETTNGAGDAGESADAEEYVVDKREFCQRCRFFSAPPAVACEHEGTDIVELVDGDRFRVRGCPMIDDDDGWRSKLADE